jgi:hypothetical protein
MIQKMSNTVTPLEKAQIENLYLIRYLAVRASAVQISAFDVSATLRQKLLLQLIVATGVQRAVATIKQF